jgi:hypothetical protein
MFSHCWLQLGVDKRQPQHALLLLPLLLFGFHNTSATACYAVSEGRTHLHSQALLHGSTASLQQQHAVPAAALQTQGSHTSHSPP